MTMIDDDIPLATSENGYSSSSQHKKKGGLPPWAFLGIGAFMVLAVIVVLALTLFGGNRRAQQQQNIVMVESGEEVAAPSASSKKTNPPVATSNPTEATTAAQPPPVGAPSSNMQMGMESPIPPTQRPAGMGMAEGMSGMSGMSQDPTPVNALPPQTPLATTSELTAATERIQKLETQLQQVTNQLQQVDSQMQQVVRALYVQPKIMTSRARKGGENVSDSAETNAAAGFRQELAEEEAGKPIVYNNKFELVAIIGDRAWLRTTGSAEVREYAVAKGDLVAGSRVSEINVPGKYVALKNGQRIR